MINAVSKVQKIASGAGAATIINASLPISIKVSEKTGFNRYNLKIGHKTLSTKSMKTLDVGGEYWGELASGSENIVIENLFKKSPLGYALPNGLALIERLISEPDLAWFYEYILQALADASSREQIRCHADMLFALQSGVVSVSFIYDGVQGIFQMGGEEIYLVFSNFAPIIFVLNAGKIALAKTPFKKVARLLAQNFDCETRVESVAAFYSPNSQILDFKG